MSPDRIGPALLLLAAALAMWPAAGRAGAARWSAVRPPDPEPAVPVSSPDSASERSRRWLLAGVAALGTAVLVGGLPGLAAGSAVVVGVDRFLRSRSPDGAADEGVALLRDLPAACDLLGVCLGAGVPVDRALEAVGSALGGPLGDRLRSVAALSRLGAEPRRAWADLPPELASLGRVLVRAGESGAMVTGSLRSLAAESRAAARAATQAAVQRAGVWVLAPLGACFLPAFLCLGVAPMVLGIAGDVLG